MTRYRFIAAATICCALALQVACAVGRAIQDTLGAMASGEPPRERPPTGIDSVYVYPPADSLEVGDSATIYYYLLPPRGKVLPNSVKVRWESSDTSVAIVTNLGVSGMVFGKKEGVATISATAHGKRGSAKVTVTHKTQPG